MGFKKSRQQARILRVFPVYSNHEVLQQNHQEVFMKKNDPLSITFCEGPASADFSGTLMNRMNHSIESDQLFIISSHAFSEMQRELARQHLPCRLLGRQQIAGWIAQKAGLEETEVADEHSRTRILEQILADPSHNFRFLAYSRQPETAARDLGTLIGRLQKAGVQPDQLETIMQHRFLSKASECRFHDLLVIMKAYLTSLKKQGKTSREDFMMEIASILETLPISTGHVFIDVLDDYDYVTQKLLAAILLKADSADIALPVMPADCRQEGNAHYRRASVFYRNLIREVRLKSARPVRIDTKPAVTKDRSPSLEAVSTWLEGTGQPVLEKNDCIQLVQCMTLEDELVAAASRIAEWIAQGVSPSGILVTGASIGKWHENLSRLLAAEGLDSVYYQGETLSRSPVYGTFSSLLAWIQDPDNGVILASLLSGEGLGLDWQERRTLLHFIQSQGPDLKEGLTRLKKYGQALEEENPAAKLPSSASRQLQEVNAAMDHLYALTETLRLKLEQAVTVSDCCSALLDFAEGSPFLAFLQSVWETSRSEDVSRAESLEQQWKAFNRLILQLDRTCGSEVMSLESFSRLIDETADEIIVSTSGQRQLSIQMEPLHSCRTIHCTHLCILGAGSNEIPVLPNPAFITDQETDVLTAAGIDFRSNRDWADESATDAVCAIANASDSVWISWHIRNDDQELEPAGFLRPLTAQLPIDDRTGESLAENAFLHDILDLQKQKGLPSYAEAARILQMKYGYSERYSRLLEQADAWIHRDWKTFSSSAASSLFKGTERLSVTSLESYNQCPFRFFMQRGLRARDPEQYEETSADRGTFLHAVLKDCLQEAKDRKISANDTETMDQILEHSLEKNLKTHNRRVLEGGGLMTYEKAMLLQSARDALRLIMEQNAESGFKPAWLEYELGDGSGMELPLSDDSSFRLTGIADRVDTWETPEGNRFGRIIDYKSGRKKKDLTRETVEAGLNLQPPLYMMALTADKNLQPAGMYYDRLSEETVELKTAETPDTSRVTGKRRSNRQMSGYTLSRPDVLEASDTAFEPGTPSYTSGVIPLTTTAKGIANAVSSRSLLSAEEMEGLMDLAVRKSCDTILSIKKGIIVADPQKENGRSPCTWCPFQESCHKNLSGF